MEYGDGCGCYLASAVVGIHQYGYAFGVTLQQFGMIVGKGGAALGNGVLKACCHHGQGVFVAFGQESKGLCPYGFPCQMQTVQGAAFVVQVACLAVYVFRGVTPVFVRDGLGGSSCKGNQPVVFVADGEYNPSPHGFERAGHRTFCLTYLEIHIGLGYVAAIGVVFIAIHPAVVVQLYLMYTGQGGMMSIHRPHELYVFGFHGCQLCGRSRWLLFGLLSSCNVLWRRG